MKNTFFYLIMIASLGCANQLQTIIESPEKFIEDPIFAEYKKNLDNLERSYLKKEITYADYLEKKKKLEEDYEKKIRPLRENF